MRTRSTNMLQIAVLVTGLIYVVIGLFLYVSPLTMLRVFAENVSENWLDLVRDNELVAPLYYITRGFSAMVFTGGLAMIMPLFDPLKYRGLIYYNGVIFPLLAAAMFLYNGLFRMVLSSAVSADAYMSITHQYHLPIVILGIVFAVIMLANSLGLMATRKLAQDGIE